MRPVAKSWQLFRDPKGTAKGLELFRSGKGKFIRGLGKPNLLLLRSFSFGGASTQLVVAINGRTVVNGTDAGGRPAGRPPQRRHRRRQGSSRRDGHHRDLRRRRNQGPKPLLAGL